MITTIHSRRGFYGRINLFLMGYFEETVDLGCGIPTSAGGGIIHVTKLDISGGCIWTKRFGQTAPSFGTALVSDTVGNVFITGLFEGKVDFGGGDLTSSGPGVMFLAKYDHSGNHLWSTHFGNGNSDSRITIATAVDGGVLAAGHFEGSADFGGGKLTSAGNRDVVIAKYDAGGNHVWSKRFGSTEDDRATFAAVDNSGNVFVTGYLMEMVDLGKGDEPAVGVWDIFLAKFGP
ncbi:MAG: hypothetical protein HY897_20795 [Deltaproteobacteria bacterium]|nr:hypothetical protein [Deltaproteobacteria bacterium]